VNNPEFSRALARAVQVMAPKARRNVQQAYLNAGFDVANAPQWLIDVAERNLVTKGEAAGHPFRGNQWTGGGGGSSLDNYQMAHRPPGLDSDVATPFHDLTANDNLVYPNDVYSSDGARLYGHGEVGVQESMQALRAARGNPEASVTIYRAVPAGVDKINPGDWVTPSRSYAQQHLESNVGEGGHIITQTVRAKDLWSSGDSLNEWGYVPPAQAAKGDVVGHEFHGNQWTGGRGSSHDSTGRMPAGQFQLNEKQAAEVMAAAENAQRAFEAENGRPGPGTPGEERYNVQVQQAREQAMAVTMSKMLGMDGPSKRLTEQEATQRLGQAMREAPIGSVYDKAGMVFRGCDAAGAESLFKPLTSYNGTGATLLGPGVYTSSNEGVADTYLQFKDSVRVDSWVDPHATRIALSDVKFLSEKMLDATSGWGSGYARGITYALEASPSLVAMAHGYQVLDSSSGTSQDVQVVLDRSVLSSYVSSRGTPIAPQKVAA
jgi:hypothetical protein